MKRLLFLGVAMTVYVACSGTAIVDGERRDDGSGGSSSSMMGTGNVGNTDTTSNTTSGPAGPTTSSGPVACELGGLPSDCNDCFEQQCPKELAVCCQTDGCIALTQCAIFMCGGGSDIGCIVQQCGQELNDAGGPGGEGTAAAQNFGSCAFVCEGCF
jgi:hypothetical protein